MVQNKSLEKKDWHHIPKQQVVEILESDSKSGLSADQVQTRKEQFGLNRLPSKKPPSSFLLFLEQFKGPLVYVLAAGAGASFWFGKFTDALVILAAMLANTIVGFIQERKASNIMGKLSQVLKSKAVVVRDGVKKKILQKDLVPGDLFLLKAGAKVPVDGRLLQVSNLRINEAPLTGEWKPQPKTSDQIPALTSLSDRKDMVYMGSTVESGTAKGLATATGLDTEIGKIAKAVRGIKEEKTPYQRKLARFSRIVAIFLSLVCLIIFAEGIVEGRPPLKMFEVAIALAVASIPEGLLVAMTVILALGMQRILKAQGLVRRLASVETLGSTSIIATDKTLTLTQGKMEISEIIGEDPETILSIGCLCSEAFVENPELSVENWKVEGGSTDRALLLGAARRGVKKPDLEKKFPELDRVPFNNKTKFTASLRAQSGQKMLKVCGAPERILNFCDLSQKQRQELAEQLRQLTAQGLRVIGVGQKILPDSQNKIPKNIKDLEFAGFIGLKDPLREGAKEAIDTCRRAGMRPIIVTGDHLLTAKAVAEKLGFKTGSENIVSGSELDQWSESEFKSRLDQLTVYARVEPKHKLRIIKAWQQRNQVVAMTGDGVNDAPALKKADVGVALGSGTEVAQQASDLILLKDKFSTIVKAVQEGRAILDNIRKVTTYLISDSFTEVLLIGVSILAKAPLPVTALQILYVNLIEDGFPAIALAFEPEEQDLMKRGPEPQQVPLLNKEMKALTLIVGIVDDFTLLGLFFWLNGSLGILPGIRASLISAVPGRALLPYVRTVVFANLATDTLYVAFSLKSLRKNLWEINLFSNKFLVAAEVVAAALLIGAIHLPLMQQLLGTVSLTKMDWLLVTLVGLFDLSMIEATKFYFIARHRE